MTRLAVNCDFCEFSGRAEAEVETSRINLRRERLLCKSIECVVITPVYGASEADPSRTKIIGAPEKRHTCLEKPNTWLASQTRKRVTASCLILAYLSSAVHFSGGLIDDPGKGAEARAVDFLRREVPAWSRDNGCFSCHNNG